MPLTAIQKGKFCSIPQDPRSPCMGSSLLPAFSMWWCSAQMVQLFLVPSSAASPCAGAWGALVCVPSVLYAVVLLAFAWYSYKDHQFVLHSLNPSGTNHLDHGSMCCCLLLLFSHDELYGTWFSGCMLPCGLEPGHLVRGLRSLVPDGPVGTQHMLHMRKGL